MRKRISKKSLALFLSISLLCTQVFAFNTTIKAASANFDLSGFATQNGGTTGGTGGKEVTISSFEEANTLMSARKKAKDTSPLIVKIAKKISGAGKIDIKEVSNITFLGSGTSGELEGIGLNIYKSKNIIVRNLKIHHTLAPLDCIGVESSTNVWVDHCELFNMIGDCNGDGKIDTKGDISGGDIDFYDGLLDVKGESAYLTVSWNYFHDAFKTSLVGSSDSDASDRKITFHHNIYKNCNSRLPSYRGGTGHMFNNYYVDVGSTAINSRVGAKLRIEGNVFENVGSGSVDDKNNCAEGPIGTYYSSVEGYWDVKDNIFTNCKGNQPTTSTCSFLPPYEYSNILTPASQVKSIVTANAGIGVIDGIFTPIPINTNTPVNPSTTATPTNPVHSSNKSTISGYSYNGTSVTLSGVGSTTTDSNGYFEITDVPLNSNYILTISKASYIAREINILNLNGNAIIGSPSKSIGMTIGDTNNDRAINMADVIKIAASFNTLQNNPNYREELDLNLDGSINMGDIILIATNFNKTAADYEQPQITITPIQSVSNPPTNTLPNTPTPTKLQPSNSPITGDITLEPNGSMTLDQAIKSIAPGKTIYLKPGNFKISATIVIAEGNNGNNGALKTIAALGSEKPVLDFSAMAENSANRGIVLAANYWCIKGVTVFDAGDNGILLAGSNNIIQDCLFTRNHDSGLQISRYNTSYNSIDKWPSNNLIVDCVATENYDSTIENADGFAAKLTCGVGNIFRNCKSIYNCDDGWDLYTKKETGPIGAVTLENCEASNNGKSTDGKVTGGDGNGFKLGDDTASVAHILKNCVANNNAKNGYTGNGNPGKIVMTNCTGTGNSQKLFDRLTNAIFN